MEKDKKAHLPSVRRQLGALQYLGNNIPMSCRKVLVTGLIQSRLNYLMPLWGSLTENHIIKLQTVWNKAARWATGLRKKTKISKLMKESRWLSIREIILP